MQKNPAQKNHEIEIKVGVFVTVGLTLIALAIMLLGGADSLTTRYNRYTTHFPAIDGLVTGSKVVVGGISVGSIEKIDFDPKRRDIEITMKVQSKYGTLVREDTVVEVATQGVLGDKYISLNAGAPSAREIPANGEIPSSPIRDLGKMFSKGDQLMVSLNQIATSMDRLLKAFESGNRSEMIFTGLASTAKNLASATDRINNELDNLKLNASVAHLNSILKKIDGGTGTLGALVNDPGLYYDARALMGGANRNRVVRNLVRKTIKDAEEEETESAAEKAPRK